MEDDKLLIKNADPQPSTSASASVLPPPANYLVDDAKLLMETGLADVNNNGDDGNFLPATNVPISGRASDRPTLLAFMYARFREKRHSFSYTADFFRWLDTLCFFLPLMALQCSVAIVYVAANSNADFQRIFSGCVSAISAVIIAIQMKLKWGEKAEKFTSGTRQYALLASEAFFKWVTAATMTEDEFRDFVKDTSQIEKEIQDTCPVPPSWIARKFEQHQLQLAVAPTRPPDERPVTLNFVDKNASSGRPMQLPSSLPPPNDPKAPPSGLFPAKSRLRMWRPSDNNQQEQQQQQSRPFLFKTNKKK